MTKESALLADIRNSRFGINTAALDDDELEIVSRLEARGLVCIVREGRESEAVKATKQEQGNAE
jgi:hypothetical protein